MLTLRVVAPLRMKPIDIGARYSLQRLVILPYANEQASGRKERHLRVVAKERLAVFIEFKLRNTPLAIVRLDSLAPTKLYGIAQRIAHSPCHQRTSHSIL